MRGIAAVTFLDMRETKLPSKECITERLKICLYRSNSIFPGRNLLQTNEQPQEHPVPALILT